MVDPSTPTPSPYSDPPPYHDPWASTVPVPAEPSPAPGPSPQPPAPPPQPPVPVSGAAYPPVSGPGTAMYPVTAPYGSPEPVIAQIGEIQVTSTSIRTPAGVFPLRGSQWTVTDAWTTEQKIPTWAIVMAIVGFFCLTVFSLLFLLAKETVYRGVVQVHVISGPYQYVARISAADQAQVQYVYQQVNYVRSLAAM